MTYNQYPPDIHIRFGSGMSASDAISALTDTAEYLEKGDLVAKRKRLPHKTMRDLEEETRKAIEGYSRSINAAVKKYFEEKTNLDNGVIAELPSMKF